MLKQFHIILSALAISATAYAGTEIVNPRCEYLTEPLGIDNLQPRFTWEVNGESPRAFSISVRDASGRECWTSGAIDGNARSVTSRPDTLTPHTRYIWQLNATGPDGKTSTANASFETGKLNPSDWQASWISDSNDREFEPAPMFRKTFNINRQLKDARLYVTAAGYYVIYINGHRVGDSHMDPGYTHYDRRNLYATYDVTPLLRKGRNVICAVLGNGFYNCQSKASWDFENARWRNRPSLMLELLGAEKKDGQKKLVVATDDSWLTATGPYTYNNIYSGDRYDNRLTPAGWTSLNFNDSSWQKARKVTAPSENVCAQAMPAIRPVETIKPRLLKNFGDTVYVYDMGRNITGVARLTASGSKGTNLKISYGEMLKPDGRLQQGNIDVYYHPVKPGEQFQTDEFTLAGKGAETFTPDFTYHGFRYAEVRADRPVRLTDKSLTGLFIHSDLKPVGRFSSSNELLNKIYDATMLSYVDNLHSIPTDCPQREKNGWTADAHAAIDLALLNYDGITFYEKWMNDIMDNQRPSGNIAGIIPTDTWGYGDWPGPVWDAVLFIIPDALYNYYGDLTAIERLYPTMERYFKWAKEKETFEGLLTNGIGDWVAYRTQTPTDYTSTLYYFIDCKLMARFARLLGRDSEPYEVKAAMLRNLINHKFFNHDDNTYAGGSQAAQALALYSGVVPKNKETAVAEKLRSIVTANNHALDFGLLGSKTVLRMLTRYGYVDDAYRMATRTEAPSWGYWIDSCKYTTLPETWTLSPEFHDASLNHVFLGDVSAWMTNDLAGINFDPDAPGFTNVIIAPNFPEGLDSAEATYHSVRGEITSSWQRKSDGSIELRVTIPSGSTATLRARGRTETLSSGTHTIRL